LFRDAKLTPAAAKSKIHLWPFLPLANFSSLFPPPAKLDENYFFKTNSPVLYYFAAAARR